MNATSYDIIVRPVITEKTSRQMELGQYTFEVLPKANKIEIRKAVEEVFKVKVVYDPGPFQTEADGCFLGSFPFLEESRSNSRQR